MDMIQHLSLGRNGGKNPVGGFFFFLNLMLWRVNLKKMPAGVEW